MRKAFEGKIYDEDYGGKMVSWDNEKSSPKYCEEILYRTEKRNWFLILSGGEESEYPEKEIKPLSKEDLFNWVQKRNVKWFGMEDHFDDVLEKA